MTVKKTTPLADPQTEPKKESDDPQYRDLILVYVGTRQGEKNKRYHSYLELATETAELPPHNPMDGYANERWFKKPLFKLQTPGSVWKTRGNDKTIFCGGTYVGRFHNSEAVMKMQAEDHTTRQRIESESTKAAAMRERLDLDALKPLRDLYWRSNPFDRQLLMLNIVRYILKGVGK